MSEKQEFEKFFSRYGIGASVITPEEVVLEMDQDVPWTSALSVGQVWFLFGENEEYLGHLNDDTMEFEARASS